MTYELAPFIEALHEIAADAGLVLLDAADPAITRRGVARYNAVSLYLVTRVPALTDVYRPLSGEATPGALRLAARDVAAFVEDLPYRADRPDADRLDSDHFDTDRLDASGPADAGRTMFRYGGPFAPMQPPGRSCACVCA